MLLLVLPDLGLRLTRRRIPKKKLEWAGRENNKLISTAIGDVVVETHSQDFEPLGLGLPHLHLTHHVDERRDLDDEKKLDVATPSVSKAAQSSTEATEPAPEGCQQHHGEKGNDSLVPKNEQEEEDYFLGFGAAALDRLDQEVVETNLGPHDDTSDSSGDDDEPSPPPLIMKDRTEANLLVLCLICCCVLVRRWYLSQV